MNIPLSPCVPENLVSRDGFSRPVPRHSDGRSLTCHHPTKIEESGICPRTYVLYCTTVGERLESFSCLLMVTEWGYSLSQEEHTSLETKDRTGDVAAVRGRDVFVYLKRLSLCCRPFSSIVTSHIILMLRDLWASILYFTLFFCYPLLLSCYAPCLM